MANYYLGWVDQGGGSAPSLSTTERLVLSQALDKYLYQQRSLRTIKLAWDELDPVLNERIRVAEELRNAVG